jgi:hypothetical protein
MPTGRKDSDDGMNITGKCVILAGDDLLIADDLDDHACDILAEATGLGVDSDFEAPTKHTVTSTSVRNLGANTTNVPGSGPPDNARLRGFSSYFPNWNAPNENPRLSAGSSSSGPPTAREAIRRSVNRLSMKLAQAALGATLQLAPQDVRPERVPPNFFIDHSYQVKSNKTLAPFTSNDYRASCFWFHQLNMGLLLVLGIIKVFWVSDGTIANSVGRFVCILVPICIFMWLVLSREPYLKDERWLLATKLASLALALMAALANCVNAIASGVRANRAAATGTPVPFGSNALDKTAEALAYATFVSALVLAIIFVGSFLIALLRGAYKEQQRITYKAIAKFQAEQSAMNNGLPMKKAEAASIFSTLMHHQAVGVESVMPVAGGMRLSIAIHQTASAFHPLTGTMAGNDDDICGVVDTSGNNNVSEWPPVATHSRPASVARGNTDRYSGHFGQQEIELALANRLPSIVESADEVQDDDKRPHISQNPAFGVNREAELWNPEYEMDDVQPTFNGRVTFTPTKK